MRLKWILIAGALVPAVIAGAAATVLLTTDFDRYRSIVARQVQAATGRQLDFGDDAELALSLSPTVVIRDVSFANADWGTQPQMARIDRLDVKLELIPLISGEIRISRLILVGADFLLETDAAGQGNWMLGEAGKESGGTTVRRLPTVNDLTVEDARVIYRDGISGREQNLALNKLTASAASAASPIALTFDGRLNGSALQLAGTVGAAQTLTDGSPLPIDLQGQGGGSKFSLTGELGQPLQGQGLSLAVLAEGRSVAEFGRLVGLSLPEIGPFSLTTDLTDTDGTFQLSAMQAKFGASDLTGDLNVTLRDGRPAIDGEIASTRLDLKDLGIKEIQNAPAGGRIFPAGELPFDLLRQADARIFFVGRQVTSETVTLENVAAEFALESGNLTVAKLEADLSGGHVSASATVDASEAPPAIAARLTARGVEAGALLQALSISRVLTGGKANLDLDIRGRGSSVRGIMATLGGRSSLEMGPGHIDNGFAELFLADLVALLSFGSTGGSSNFNCLVSRFEIDNGVAASRGLVIDANGATIVGSGTIQLKTETLDLRFDPSAKQASLSNLAVPVQVRGPLIDPTVTPDPVGVATDGAGAAALVAPGGIFALLAGVTGSNLVTGTDNPCATALDSPSAKGQQPKKGKSAGEQILEGTGKAIEDIGSGIKSLFE